jgi:hypothetical protein
MLSMILAAALAQAPALIIIDNRAESCDASSRIAEGNRRRARIEALRLARDYKAQGVPVRVVTLETGDRSMPGDTLIRTDCQ